MNDSVLKPFGLHIKSLRTSLNISQEELASRSGLDRTYVSGIERGKRNVGLVNLFRLAQALDLSPSDLLSFDVDNSHE
ncbi:transcriptional regulator [Veronia nyctiphanis]|uniref:Transcriptional regulator n=1 Tax=Veronia nyctiphanis TaxID=1278244 RepID=A0A4Q0YRS7_9GAMM|nr:helix-turn-helix transcriptional regulator [Veronia nyctiphanis]RXJ73842.1 transcriptional regulator [Veronia nyctiphanis]